jgi:hypothetical protein
MLKNPSSTGSVSAAQTLCGLDTLKNFPSAWLSPIHMDDYSVLSGLDMLKNLPSLLRLSGMDDGQYFADWTRSKTFPLLGIVHTQDNRTRGRLDMLKNSPSTSSASQAYLSRPLRNVRMIR